MIPLRDSSAPRRLTPVNLLLIVINIAVFAYELSLRDHLEPFVLHYAMVPLRVTASVKDFDAIDPRYPLWPILSLITSIFVHGGILHVAGNVLYLFIVGAAADWRV